MQRLEHAALIPALAARQNGVAPLQGADMWTLCDQTLHVWLPSSYRFAANTRTFQHAPTDSHQTPLVMPPEPQPRISRQPLANRTVVITRARAQADEFASALESYGARVVACPTIEIVEPESYAALDEAIENLFGYDWLIFTSVNSVDYFFRRLALLGHDVGEIDELRVCATGAATADRLRDVKVHVDVVPIEFKAEGVFAALSDYVGGSEALACLNFLLPRAVVARDFLPHALAEAGARVDVVAAYRTVPPQTTDRARVEAMLVGGAVDCITFTSSSTVNNFAQLFDTTDLRALLAGVTVACIGDITARTAADYGLSTNIQPAEFTTPALARAIADYFATLDA